MVDAVFNVKLQGTFYWCDWVRSPVSWTLMVAAGHICDVHRSKIVVCKLLSNTLRNEQNNILKCYKHAVSIKVMRCINALVEINISSNVEIFIYCWVNVTLKSGTSLKCCSYVIASAIRDERRYSIRNTSSETPK